MLIFACFPRLQSGACTWRLGVREAARPTRRTTWVRDRLVRAECVAIFGTSSGQGKIVLFKRFQYYAAQLQWQQHLAANSSLCFGACSSSTARCCRLIFRPPATLIQSRLRRMWERPLRGLGGSWGDVYSNILFFMPWGFLLAIWRAGRGSPVVGDAGLGAAQRGVLERIGGVCPVIRPAALAVGRRPGDQHIRLGRGRGDRLAAGAAGSGRSRRSGFASCSCLVPCDGVRLAVACGFAVRRSFSFVQQVGLPGASRPRSEMARLIPFGPSSGGPTPAAKACLWGCRAAHLDAGRRCVCSGGAGIGRRRRPRDRLAVALATGLSLAIEVDAAS